MQMPKLIPEVNDRRFAAYAGFTLVLISAVVIIAGSNLLNRAIARGDELQAQLNDFLAVNKLPGQINVFWYDNRIFVYSPVTDDQLPHLLAIIGTAGWVRDIDLRNTMITEAGSDQIIRLHQPASRVLTPWNAKVTPFLYD